MKRKKKKHQRLYIKVKQNKPREHIQRKIKKKTFRKRESPVINRGERREGGDRQKMKFKEI